MVSVVVYESKIHEKDVSKKREEMKEWWKKKFGGKEGLLIALPLPHSRAKSVGVLSHVGENF